MNETTYFELDNLIYGVHEKKVYLLVKDGAWDLLEKERQDGVAEELHFNGETISFEFVQDWAKKNNLGLPKELKVG